MVLSSTISGIKFGENFAIRSLGFGDQSEDLVMAVSRTLQVNCGPKTMSRY